ncbi:hypothetical protein ACT3R7_12150 [Halomonas sp. AOP43-A1-21]
MNIVITVHPGRADAFKVALSADSEHAPAVMESERLGHEDEISLACSYLSGLDGKLVSVGVSATAADLAIVIGKHHGGDIEVTAGQLPASLLSDAMSDGSEGGQ